MEQIDGSETSEYKTQTPGIHPKDYSQYIQGVSGGIVNNLGGGSMDYSE
jgi:hypothetical protein